MLSGKENKGMVFLPTTADSLAPRDREVILVKKAENDAVTETELFKYSFCRVQREGEAEFLSLQGGMMVAMLCSSSYNDGG